MANNPTDRGPLLPTRNIYVINSASELPQILSQYVIYNLQYDPGDGIGLYFSSDGSTLTPLVSGPLVVPDAGYPPQLGYAGIV